MTTTDLDSAVALARALGHPARLRTVAMLRSGELCVCQITEVLKLAPSTVSAHLKELKGAQLITERKDGRWAHIGLTDDPVIKAWIDVSLNPLADDSRLTADACFVEEIRKLSVEDLCRFGYEEAKRLANTTT